MDALHAKEKNLVIRRQTSEVDSLEFFSCHVGPIRHAQEVRQVDTSGLLASLSGLLEVGLRSCVLDQLEVTNTDPTVIVSRRVVQPCILINASLEVFKVDPTLNDTLEHSPRDLLLDKISYSWWLRS
jgi:hypothetical protein